jgi:hypothetical protein
VLDLSWPTAESSSPEVTATFVRCAEWAADASLAEETRYAYDVLLPLRNTELARVPEAFQPLTSFGSRGAVCSMGSFICSLLRSSLNTQRRQRGFSIDAVLLMGGNIRGGTEYPQDCFFSLE